MPQVTASHSETLILALVRSRKLFPKLWPLLHTSASCLIRSDHWAGEETGKDGQWLCERPWSGEQFSEKCPLPWEWVRTASFFYEWESTSASSPPTPPPAKYFQRLSSDLLSQKGLQSLMSYRGMSLGSKRRAPSLSSNKHLVFRYTNAMHQDDSLVWN